jgi:alpha/beta superfamily hydrolase
MQVALVNHPQKMEFQVTEEMEVLTEEEALVSHSPKVNTYDSQNSQKANIKGEGCAEDMMDVESFLDKDSEGEHTEWHAPKSRKFKKPKKVVMATRTSSRIPTDGIPIAEKAAQRAMEKNTIAGINSNPFTILNNCPNSVLQNVIADLDLEIGNVDECLDAFKAEEIARAKIAEAKYNSFLEKQKQKSTPKTVEDEHDLTMEVISNSQRDFILDSLKGRDDSMNSNEQLGANNTQNQK